MRLSADTNLLLRVVLRDDPQQTALAEQTLLLADPLVISILVLCEMAWTLSVRGYSSIETATAIEALTAPDKTQTDRPIVEAGLAMLRRGGGFADGCILEMARREKARLVTFDKRLVALGQEDAVEAKVLISSRKL